MKIRVRYGFYTDGDYSLRNYDEFGCTGREVEVEGEHFDYVGVMDFENKEIWRCKCDAKSFLEKLICDGIHISHTHDWIMKDFYDAIESLMEFINKNDSGEFCERLSGNYDGTFIRVEFI